MSRPIVICLQFWHGDSEVAFRNARRIADNEPAFRDDIEFCFVTRRGTEHNAAIIAHVAKKFKVTTYTANRFEGGWPAGCNAVWCDLFQESHRRVKSGEWANVRALFTFESDCIPVARDWLDRLHTEWTLAENEGKWMTGWVTDHINGNALFHPNLFHFLPRITGCPANMAWDYYFRKDFEPHWRRANYIENLYNQRGVLRSQLQDIVESGMCLIHGVKDLSVEEFADSLLRKQ